jgi:single-strand DNA-binding protein
MFNLTVLQGRLTGDAELRYTQNNVPVTSFTIAVERRVKAGEEKVADFINIVAWRSTAEFITKYFSKGSMIGIEGAIQTRKYTEKDTGKQRTAFEVVASNAHFIESKKTENDALKDLKNKIDDFAEISADDELPFK